MVSGQTKKGDNMRRFKYLITIVVLLLVGCFEKEIDSPEIICEPCTIIVDEVESFQGILFNGVDGAYLYSVYPAYDLPDGMLLDEKTNEMIEFFNDGNVLKIIPDGEDGAFIYGVKYTVDESHLNIVFYANNEKIEEVNYTYQMSEVIEEGYSPLLELVLIDSDDNKTVYIQIQKIFQIDQGDE